MVKESTWNDKNVDLKKLGKKVELFFHANKFSEVQSFDDPSGNFIQIQARKTGVFQTLTSQRKALQVIIRGDVNNFLVSVTSGQWGNNLVAAALFNPAVSLAGLGFNASFLRKIWNFINEAIESLENSYQKPLQTKSQDETPLQILQKRVALGEITKEEYEELSSMLGKKDETVIEEIKEEPKPQNFARLIRDDD